MTPTPPPVGTPTPAPTPDLPGPFVRVCLPTGDQDRPYREIRIPLSELPDYVDRPGVIAPAPSNGCPRPTALEPEPDGAPLRPFTPDGPEVAPLPLRELPATGSSPALVGLCGLGLGLCGLGLQLLLSPRPPRRRA